jgi:hypothetical protein
MSADDPKATTVLFVGIVSVVAVFLIVVMLQIVFYRMQEREVARKSLDLAPEELAQLRASQQAELHSYGWIDEAGGVARIPIERAMELTVEEINRPAPVLELAPADDPAPDGVDGETLERFIISIHGPPSSHSIAQTLEELEPVERQP